MASKKPKLTKKSKKTNKIKVIKSTKNTKKLNLPNKSKQTKSSKVTKKSATYKKPAKPTIKTKSDLKPKKKIINKNLIGFALACLVVITYGVSLYAALKINLAPTKYMVFIVPISLLIIAAVTYANIRFKWQNFGKSILLVAVSLLVLFANGYVYSLSKSTSDFFANIQSGEYRLESYSLITKTNYQVTLKNSKTVGYITDDLNNSSVLGAVANKTNANQKPSNELASLTIALDEKSVDTVVVRSSILPLLEQNYTAFYQSLVVLETFEIKVKNNNTANNIDITKPYAVYIGGIDTYGDIESVSRSDVNIIAVINPQTRKVLLINTPRDYYVQLHGTTGVRDKLTHAGIYGVEMSRQTLEDLYGMPINYSVRINFTSLLKIIDAIGGINVYSDNDFTSYVYTFTKGYNQLNSEQALEFSRSRKPFEDGDRTRGKNQQRVIEAIISKLNDPRYLLKYQTIVKSLGSTFQTNASKDAIAGIVKQQMNSLGNWQVESVSADGLGATAPTYSMGAQNLYVMEPNADSLNAIRQKITEYLK